MLSGPVGELSSLLQIVDGSRTDQRHDRRTQLFGQSRPGGDHGCQVRPIVGVRRGVRLVQGTLQAGTLKGLANNGLLLPKPEVEVLPALERDPSGQCRIPLSIDLCDVR